MNDKIFEDAFNLLCGEKLGSGIHRDVFECRIRNDLVVKVEQTDSNRNFMNVFEQKFWDDNQYYEPVARWLAPCEYLSPDGRILLQKRVKPMIEDRELPDNLPGFLTDVKAENFGYLDDNRIVCFDYALHLSNPNIRLRKVAK